MRTGQKAPAVEQVSVEIVFPAFKRKETTVKNLEELTKLDKSFTTATLDEREFRRHTNYVPDGFNDYGLAMKIGGFVEKTASVDNRSFIDIHALVLDKASVSDGVKVLDYGIISGNVQVYDGVTVKDHGKISGEDHFYFSGENVEVSDNAEVSLEKGKIMREYNLRIGGKAKITDTKSLVEALKKGDAKYVR